jgi:hypothetical protein
LFFARFDGITGSVGKILILRNVYVGMTNTSENNMESLIKKLQSLQNKTTANGCTEQEALHAAEKVAELLDKYGLSIEQLKLDTAKDECSAGAFDLGSKRQTHPVVLCMSAIAKYTSTKSWYKNGGSGPIEYTFFGFRTDVEIAGWLLKTFKEAMDTGPSLFGVGNC